MPSGTGVATHHEAQWQREAAWQLGRVPLTLGFRMRTELTLDNDLLEAARELTGLRDANSLVHAALTTLVERESARRLARLGGSQPELKPVARRRLGPA
jgi:Arc/MetJ family transcription regulator